jgi:hypothetical protein
MITSRTYPVVANVDYIEATSLVASDVLVVDRNGIGVRHDATFSSTPVASDIIAFEWVGLYTNFVTDSDFFIRITNLGNKTQTWLIGPAPSPNVAYVIWMGPVFAYYITQSGDDKTDVRDGLLASVNAASWGFTFTATAVATDKIRIVTPDQQFFAYSLAKAKYKSGLYTILSGAAYLISSLESDTDYPPVPLPALSYDFGNLTLMPLGLLEYLKVPSQPAYEIYELNEGPSDILKVPNLPSSVPVGQCVVNEAEQRVYFHENLGFGETIKIISK